MKKILMFLLVACMAAPMVYSQNKALEKARKKEFKTKMKEYKKEGWKLFASSRSLDVALLTHYDKLNTMGEDAFEVTGIASKFKSKNVGKQMAQNSACVSYASQAGSHVKGRVISDLFGDGVDPTGEFDRFYAAYERLVEKEIKGELMESYSVIRENGDGTYELQTFFIVSEAAASKARMRAYENALKESEAAQRYGNKVADFVREGFKGE
ncbi:MAG: hypothetical protein IJ417_03635 [Bacteroidaceae bacterium]|nr:hypothetical protein [Bacteroidaceae bacterium]